MKEDGPVFESALLDHVAQLLDAGDTLKRDELHAAGRVVKSLDELVVAARCHIVSFSMLGARSLDG